MSRYSCPLAEEIGREYSLAPEQVWPGMLRSLRSTWHPRDRDLSQDLNTAAGRLEEELRRLGLPQSRPPLPDGMAAEPGREPGGRYFDAYWGREYTVDAVSTDVRPQVDPGTGQTRWIPGKTWLEVSWIEPGSSQAHLPHAAKLAGHRAGQADPAAPASHTPSQARAARKPTTAAADRADTSPPALRHQDELEAGM